MLDTYRSGWLTMGPRTEELERAFAHAVGVPHAVAVSSGTAALHLVCVAAGLGPGDEAVVPSLTFVATANAVRYTGARPVFADVAGATTPWMTAETAAPAIGPRTKAIVAMAYGGHPDPLPGLRRLAEERGLLLLEDAAHAPGAAIGGRNVGTFGAAAAFSMFSNKNLPVGEGGMVTTADGDWAERIRLLRSHGQTAGTWQRHRGGASGYDVVDLGFNYRLDEPRAALGLRRLVRLDRERRDREALVTRYRAALSDVPGARPLEPDPAARSAHHLFPLVLDPAYDRQRVRARIAEAGIQTSVHYPPVHRTVLYARGGTDALPATEDYARRTVTLPLFGHLTEDQQDAVIAAVRRALA